MSGLPGTVRNLGLGLSPSTADPRPLPSLAQPPLPPGVPGAAAPPSPPPWRPAPPPYPQATNPAAALLPPFVGQPFDPRPLVQWQRPLDPAGAARQAREAAAAAQQGRAPKDPDEDRSTLSKAAIQAAFVGGLAKSALDLTRVAVKAPEAWRAGIMRPWLANLVKVAPDTRVIDPRMPRVATAASGWRSFTRFDEATYRGTAVLGAGLSTIQLASAIPNLIEAVQDDGLAGLVNTTSGRSGVLQAAGGMLGLGTLGYAALGARQAGARGFVETIVRASASPRLATPFIANIGLVAGALVLANEWGFFDFLNKDDDRPLGRKLSDAAKNLPFV